MRAVFAPCPQTAWLKTLPGVGDLLAIVIWTEIGTLARFPRAEALASYSGLVPREHSSGGKVRFGAVRRDVNQYLKWAFVEAANSAVLNRTRCGYTHISKVYERLRARRGQGEGGGGAAPGGSEFLDVDEGRALSGPDGVHTTVSAVRSWVPRDPDSDCDTVVTKFSAAADGE